MSVYVATDPKNQPKSILTIDLVKAKFLSHDFLGQIITPYNKVGVKRSTYYILNTDIILHAKRTRQILLLQRFLSICVMKGYQMLMIKY